MGRFSTRAQAAKLLKDINDGNMIANLQALLDKMNQIKKSGMSEEDKNQFISYYNDKQKAANQEVFNREATLRHLEQEQISQISKISTLLDCLRVVKDKLENITKYTTYQADKYAKKEQEDYKAIADNCGLMKEFLDNYHNIGFIFPIDSEDIIYQVDWLTEKTAETFSKPTTGNLDLSKKEPDAIEFKLEVGKNKTTMSGYKLFPHEPDPEDIHQGTVGDCYMHSSIYSITNLSPDLIRDMMRQNDDGTVTVKFWGNKNKSDFLSPDFVPMYITVPLMQTKDRAEGAMWTQALELAFAVSGLGLDPQGVIKDDSFNFKYDGKQYNFGELRRDPSKHMNKLIDAGVASKFTQSLTGVANEPPLHFSSLTSDEKIKSTIQNAIREKKQIACSIHQPEDSQAEKTKDKKTKDGIDYDHSYAITKIDDQYVYLKNPHNAGKGSNDKENEFKMTLTDFKNNFDQIDIGNIPEKYKAVEPKSIKDNYKDMINELTMSLRKHDNFLLRMFSNTPQFNELRKSVERLNAKLQSNSATADDITKNFKSMVYNAKNYRYISRAIVKSGKRRECRMDIADTIVALGEKIFADKDHTNLIEDPSAVFKRVKQEVVAEKMARGINNHLNIQEGQNCMSKEMLLKMPIFNNMAKSQNDIDTYLYNSSSQNMVGKLLGKLKEAKQEITAEKLAKNENAPQKEIVNEKSLCSLLPPGEDPILL